MSKADLSQGWDGERFALVFYDLYSKYTDMFPTGSKSSVEAEDSIKQFKGEQYVSSLYCDNAPELKKAAKYQLFYHQRKQKKYRNCGS